MRSSQPVMRRALVLPLGGAVEVARSYLKVHVRHGWTGRCRGCGDPYPCKDRRDARRVLGGIDPAPGPAGKHVALLALPTLAGMVLIALVAVGLVP